MKHIRAFFEGLFARGSAKKAKKRLETALAGDRLASASTVDIRYPVTCIFSPTRKRILKPIVSRVFSMPSKAKSFT